jgi:hypothetical protein
MVDDKRCKPINQSLDRVTDSKLGSCQHCEGQLPALVVIAPVGQEVQQYKCRLRRISSSTRAGKVPRSLQQLAMLVLSWELPASSTMRHQHCSKSVVDIKIARRLILQ